MQEQNNINNSNQNTKDFYNNSVLRQNLISDYISDLSANETIDPSVEKCVVEMANEFIDSILDMSCQIAKHKKTETLTVNEIIYSMEKNYEIAEPNRYSQNIQKLKSNELKSISTADHKKRVELTREECKI